MTLAERYNTEARRLMPHMADDLEVDPALDKASTIDELVFQRSEYLGGMAAVLLELVKDRS